MPKRFKITGLAVCLSLCLSILGSLWFFMYDQQHLPFDSEKWKQAPTKDTDQPTSRQKMLDDLLSKHKLVGMKRKEIEDLLGKPTDGGPDENYYLLGVERGFIPLDYEYLLIKFKNELWKRRESSCLNVA